MRKIISAITVSAGLLLLAGCSETRVVKDDSVAAMFARSVPAGDVVENNAVVTASQSAANSPSYQSVTNALNAANGQPATSTPGALNSLNPVNIVNAIQNAIANAAAAKSSGSARTVYGPAPVVVGPFNVPVIYGPGPVTFSVPAP